MPAWTERSVALRGFLRDMLGLPAPIQEQKSEVRKEIVRDDVRIQCLLFETEPDQYVPANLYLPEAIAGRVPAFVVSSGHRGSKSVPDYQYFGQLMAKLGYVCLVPDPLGEEERQLEGRLATCDHDRADVVQATEATGRNLMGKLVLDMMRGIDYLVGRPEVDPERIAVAGYSLGGTICGFLVGVDTRVRLSLPVGYAFRASDINRTLPCISLPMEKMVGTMTTGELIGLGAPHCAALFSVGDTDLLLDTKRYGGTGMKAVRELAETLEEARYIYEMHGCTERLQLHVEPGMDHQPLHIGKRAALFAARFLGDCRYSEEELLSTPEIKLERWLERVGQRIDVPHYATPGRVPGTRAIDLGIRPCEPAELACLHPHEVGDPRYTLEGWVASISK